MEDYIFEWDFVSKKKKKIKKKRIECMNNFLIAPGCLKQADMHDCLGRRPFANL